MSLEPLKLQFWSVTHKPVIRFQKAWNVMYEPQDRKAIDSWAKRPFPSLRYGCAKEMKKAEPSSDK